LAWAYVLELGVAKHSLGYLTPQIPNADTDTELFDIVPAQSLVELVGLLLRIGIPKDSY